MPAWALVLALLVMAAFGIAGGVLVMSLAALRAYIRELEQRDAD